MTIFRLVTWNVLHRVHAANWPEPSTANLPPEPARLRAIANRVREWLEDGADAVCLQEVSGDQLAALRAGLPETFEVVAHRYPRVPQLRKPGRVLLDDSSEHLVVVSRAGRAQRSLGETSADDGGKGLLAVQLDAALVVCTHVSFGSKGAAQLARLAAVARQANGPALIAGDFNAPREAVATGLGEDFLCADLAGQPPTRVGQGRAGAEHIDHVAVRGAMVRAARVLDTAGLSDHAPVDATLALRGLP